MESNNTKSKKYISLFEVIVIAIIFLYIFVSILTQNRLKQHKVEVESGFYWPTWYFADNSFLDNPSSGETRMNRGEGVVFGFTQYHGEERTGLAKFFARLDNHLLILLNKQDEFWYDFKR